MNFEDAVQQAELLEGMVLSLKTKMETLNRDIEELNSRPSRLSEELKKQLEEELTSREENHKSVLAQEEQKFEAMFASTAEITESAQRSVLSQLEEELRIKYAAEFEKIMKQREDEINAAHNERVDRMVSEKMEKLHRDLAEINDLYNDDD